MTSEFTMALSISADKFSRIRADVPTQLEWLAKIASGVRDLRTCTKDLVGLDEADTAIGSLRGELLLPRPQSDRISAGWANLIIHLLIATSSSDEGGHARNEELAHVFTCFIESCVYGAHPGAGSGRGTAD